MSDMCKKDDSTPTYLSKGVEDAETFSKIREKIDESDLAVEEAILNLNLKGGEKILDFGCGEGSLLYKYYVPIAEKYDCKIVGVDISEAMIERAKDKNSHPKVEYFCGDIFSNDFSLEPQSFDRIMSVWVFDYFTDYGYVLQELAKLLKPKGQIWILTSAEEKYFYYYEKIRQDEELTKLVQIPAQPDWIIENKSAEEKYIQAVKKANLTLNNIQTRVLYHHWIDMNECTNFFTGILSSASKLPAEKLKKLKNICKEEILKNWLYCEININSPFNTSYKMLTLTASKDV